MRVVRRLGSAGSLPLAHPVVTLGMFDGVHLGHRAVIGRVVGEARRRCGTAVVVTFGRHPRAVIEGKAPQLITPLRQRLRIFKELGVDVTLLLHFDGSLRSVTAEDFARRVFAETLGAELVVLGYNNRFGRGGRGDVRLLRRVGPELGFTAEEVPEVLLDGEPLSSTAIRAAILEGELERAGRMLGRPYSVAGTVVHGDHRGTTIGFPTANLNLHHAVRPPRGVYGVEVRWNAERRHGLVNIGIRPTVRDAVGGPLRADDWEARDRLEHVEVHVLDFEGDLYGRTIEVLFLARIRGEQRFPSLDALRARIARDCEEFRAWLGRTGGERPR